MEGFRNRIVGSGTESPGSIAANPKNWRTHPQAQADALAGVLDQVGWVQEVIVNRRTGLLIDGHLRVNLAIQRGETEVPVKYVDLSPEEEALVLATLDPLGAMAEADAAKLDVLLREVGNAGPALDAMLAELAKDAGLYKSMEVNEDEVPPVSVDPITKPGDLWILGEHRLLCGDSTKAEDVARVMGGERAGLCFTSPPYAQQRDYGAKITDWDGLMRGVFGNLPMADDGQVLVNLGLVHREGEWWPYWDGWIEWMRGQGWRRFGWYVWDQGWGLPGDWNGRLAPSHEFLFHFNRDAVRPAKTMQKQADSITNGRDHTILRDKTGKTKGITSPDACLSPTKIPDSVLRINRQCGVVSAGMDHPAAFPVAFSAAILACWPGLTYEPFAGSGTTIIAAEQLSRRCYAIELEPRYVDVCVARWEKLTGKQAVLAQRSESR